MTTRDGMTLNERVSRTVRILMAAAGMSQQELAEGIGLSQPAVSRRLRNATTWDLRDLDELAALLGIDVEEILTMTPGRAASTRWLPQKDSNLQPAGLEDAAGQPTRHLHIVSTPHHSADHAA
jgi:transcriptional regulator with XRE-family HTH domain